MLLFDKFFLIVFTASLCIVLSCNDGVDSKAGDNERESSLQAESGKPFDCYPDTLIPGDSVRINLPQDHPGKMAIITPDEEFYFLQNPPDALMYPADAFKALGELYLGSRLQGTVWKEGVSAKKDVFTKEGSYRIIISDNLETEFENMNYLDCTVYFKKK